MKTRRRILSLALTLLLLFTLVPSVKELAHGFHALFPATILGSVTMLIVSSMTQAPPQETIERHFAIFGK